MTAKKSEKEPLLMSEPIYKEIFENNMDAILVTAPDGCILSANPAACEMFGRTKSEILRVGRKGIFDPSDNRLQNLLSERAETGKARGELLLLRKDGSSFPVEIVSSIFTDTSGEARTVMIICDITEHKREEKALRENEERFTTVSRIATDIVYERDLQTGVATFYGDIDGHLGYEPGKFPRTMEGWREHVHPEDLARIEKQSLEQLGPNTPYGIEYRMKKKDGSYITWWNRIILKKDEKTGKPVKFIGAVTDITERKKEEETLSNSEEKFRKIFENSNVGISVTSLDGTLNANTIFCDMLGYSKEELSQHKWMDMTSQEDIALSDNYLGQLSSGKKKSVRFEKRYVKKNGSILFADASVVLQKDKDGKPLYYVTTIVDITERKWAEETLHESEERFRRLYEQAPLGYQSLDVEGRFIDVNLAWLDLLGYSRDQVIGRWFGDFLAPHEVELFKERFPRFKATGEVHIELEMVRHDGSKIIVHIDGRITYDEQNQFKQTHCLLTNITERKRAEEALRRSEDNFHRSIDESPLGIRIVTANGETLYANRAILEIYGYETIEELKTTPVIKRYTPESYAEFKIRLGKRQKGESLSHEYEINIVRKNGELRHLQVFRKEILWNSEKQSQVIYIDITGRRRTDEQLRYQAILLTNVNDAIIASDVQFRLTHWNAAAESLYGWKAEEVLGRNGLEIVHTEWIGMDADEMRYMIAETGHWRGEATQVRKDGTRFPVEVSSIVLRDESRQIKGYVSVNRDITERKQTEEMLRENEEKYRLLSEQSGIGIGLYSPNGKILFFNNKALNNMGGKTEDYIGKSLTEVFGEQAGIKYLKRIRKAIRTGKSYDYEDFLQFPFGNYWFLSNYTSICNPAGKVIGVQVLAHDITERRKVEEKLKQSTKELRELTQHLEEVREDERTQIAHDLHDDLGQKLTALNMDISWLKSRTGIQSYSVANKLIEMGQLVNDTLTSTREISYGLKPSILDDLGLHAAIEWQLTEFHKSTGISCSVSSIPKDMIIDKKISLVVFRIVQEALTNVTRHSKATNVSLKINANKNLLKLTLKDNGVGIKENQIKNPKSFGLIGMKERVKSYGGNVVIKGGKRNGTVVIVTFPAAISRVSEQ